MTVPSDAVVDAVGGQGLSGAQFLELRKWLADALAVERHVIGLELERRHQCLLADCATQWSEGAQCETPAKYTPGYKASAEEFKVLGCASSPEGGGDNDRQSSSSQEVPEAEQGPRPSEGSKKGGAMFGATTKVEAERWTQRLVESSPFEIFFLVLICSNTFIMALESQYNGLGLGHDLKVPTFGETKQDLWPGAKEVFLVLEWIFGICFTFEVIIKIVGLRGQFFCDLWNLFDGVIVGSWLLDVLPVAFDLPIDPMVLRLVRLARLLRLVRLIKKLQGVDQLFLMMTTLKGSLSVLVWTVLFLLICQTMFALFCNQIIVSYYLENTSEDIVRQRETFKYFGTFTRSMLSMFEITLGNWVPVARNLYENVTPWWIFFSLLHKLSMGFAVLGVINGIFIQESMKVAACDDTILLIQKERQLRVHGAKMQAFFAACDESGDGKLDREEFIECLENPKIKTWLAAQELNVDDADRLFTLLGGEESGELTALDLVNGASKLKGPAKSMDLNMLLRDVHVLHEMVQKISGSLSGANSGDKALAMMQAYSSVMMQAQNGVLGTNGGPAWQEPPRQLFGDSPADAANGTHRNSNEVRQPLGSEDWEVTPVHGGNEGTWKV